MQFPAEASSILLVVTNGVVTIGFTSYLEALGTEAVGRQINMNSSAALAVTY